MSGRGGNGWLAFTVVVLLGLAGWGGSCCVRGCNPDYSEGDRVGVVSKLSRKGLLIKSWEGEQVAGGTRAGTSANGDATLSANVFEFSIRDEATARAVEAAMAKGQAVRIHYRQWWVRPIAISTRTEVNAVSPVMP